MAFSLWFSFIKELLFFKPVKEKEDKFMNKMYFINLAWSRRISVLASSY